MTRTTTTTTPTTTATARTAARNAATPIKQLVINWGGTAPISHPNILNKPESVSVAINKLLAFQKMAEAGVRIPAHSNELAGVRRGIWLARTNLGGSGGAGIVVVREGDAIPVAPLYVEYIPKLVEYRVHVFKDKVIFAQQKKQRKNESLDRDEKLIRNHDNGWVFCPIPVEQLTEDTKHVAVNAVAGCDLHFGAVDIVLRKSDSLAHALEVNTAPGLESPGLIEAYTSAFFNAYKELSNDSTSPIESLPSGMEVQVPSE